MIDPAALFRGPQGLRERGERATLVAVLLALPLTVVVLGWVFQHEITWQQGALLLVVALLYVTLGRGRLLGTALRVHPGQFGDLHEVVESCARMIGIATPQVFLRDDPVVPCVALGVGEPYALAISSQFVDHLRPAELRFLVGRELAGIASGDVRLTSLLSANGRENAVISIAFGPWLRKVEYTADRVGLLCAGSLDAALTAIAVTSLNALGRRVDLRAFAEQRRDLDAEPVLRAGEWLGGTPYATHRIARLRAFAVEARYLAWAAVFAERSALPSADAPGAAIERAVAVGPFRRVVAGVIDAVVAGAIATGIGPVRVATPDPSQLRDPEAAAVLRGLHDTIAVATSMARHLDLLALLVYYAALVTLVGRTVGMLVADVRVVSATGGRIGLAGALARQAAMLAQIVWAPSWLTLFRRVTFYDRLSRTRLVAGAIRRDGGASSPTTPAAAANVS